MVAINRGDNTRAFGRNFLRIYLNNPNNLYISKAVFHINGELEKVYENPIFPLNVNFTGEETMKLKQDNTCKLALWDESGRRITADGKFTFFVKENRIKEPDNPDYYGEEYQEEDHSVYFSLEDTEFAAEFVINVTPKKMSELEQDITFMSPENVIGGRNVHTYVQGDNVIVEAELDAVQSYNSLIDKPSVNGIELKGDVTIECEQVQADWHETNPESKAYIKNRPTLAQVAYTANYNDLTGKPTIPTKISDLENDSHFIDKHTDKLENYYTKEEVEEKIDQTFDPEPIYEAIGDVQANVEVVDQRLTEATSQLDTEIMNEANLLRDQINNTKENLQQKINAANVRIDNTQLVVNGKVDQGEFEQELSLKANLTDVQNALAQKVNLDTYTAQINRKADKSSIGNGTITITSNDVTKGEFNLNDMYGTTIEIPVPQNVSQLNNDLDFITRSELVTDGFATKEELEDATATKVDITELGHGILTIKVNNEEQGNFSANAMGDKTINLEVPKKLSELEKDIDILTEHDLDQINNRLDNISDRITNNAENISDLYNELGEKVDAEEGKSLLANSEISRLANLHNYDDTQVRTSINVNTQNINTLTNSLYNKVDKVSGKGLSSNDFTDAYKNKVDTANEAVTQLTTDVETLQTASTNHGNAIAGLQETTTELTNGLRDEVLNRTAGINDLQAQIDGMEAKSSVKGIVQSYSELNSFDTSKLLDGDVVCVLCDETQDDATTYYEFKNNMFRFIGSEGSKYSKAESDERFVQRTVQVNGHTLAADVELTATDVHALPENTVIGNGRLTIQVEPGDVSNIGEITEEGTFDANQTTNNAIRIPIPTKTSHLENDAEFVNQNALDGAIETTNDHFMVVDTCIDQMQGDINTLQGVIAGEVSGLSKVSFTNDYRDLDNKPTIPTVLSQLNNDMGYVPSNFDPMSTTLEDLLDLYLPKANERTKLSQLENDRGYVTNSAIGRGILTIGINGNTVGTWMANEKENVTIDIPVDDTLSDTSTLPVQNNTIFNALADLDNDAVHKAGDETITGNKTFTGNNTFQGIVNLTTANSTTVDRGDNSTKVATTAFVKNQDYCTNTDAVHKSGTETISGNKTFTGTVALNTVTADTPVNVDNSNNVATTAFVKNQNYALNSNVLHLTGNEAVQGNKTFNDTTTFNGRVELGDDARVDTPTVGSTHYHIKQVTNVEYVAQEIVDCKSDIQLVINDVDTRLQGRIGAVEQALEDYDIQKKTYHEITQASSILELDSLNYITVTQNTSISTPTVSDNYHHEIRVQMYVPSTDYTINLGTQITIDEAGMYDITYIWFKPLERWICNIVKY